MVAAAVSSLCHRYRRHSRKRTIGLCPPITPVSPFRDSSSASLFVDLNLIRFYSYTAARIANAKPLAGCLNKEPLGHKKHDPPPWYFIIHFIT